MTEAVDILPLKFKTVDWGPRPRGQGKRNGGMIMGAMSDAPTGKKSYVDYAKTFNLSKDQAEEVGYWGYSHPAFHIYWRARASGLNHDAAMLEGYKGEE